MNGWIRLYAYMGYLKNMEKIRLYTETGIEVAEILMPRFNPKHPLIIWENRYFVLTKGIYTEVTVWVQPTK